MNKVGIATATCALLLLVACRSESATAEGPTEPTATTEESQPESEPDESETSGIETEETPEGKGSEADLVRAEVDRTYDVDVQMISIPDNPEAVARGEHIANSWGYCSLCHFGPTFSGSFSHVPYRQVFMVAPPNLTPGPGGIGAYYTDEDWVRTLRHGVKPNGRSVVGMPSRHFSNMSDEDLGALIAYFKALQPIEKAVGPTGVRAEATLADLDDVELLPARTIDHEAARPTSIDPAPTADYGEYLMAAAPCRHCHGDQLNGARHPYRGEEPARNLTPGGDLSDWTLEDFETTLRTGVNPDGDQLRQLYMPPPIYNGMTDMELAAIFAYLQTLPALEDGY